MARAGRRLAAAGLVQGTAGNVSARAGGLVAVTPTGAELSGLAADDVPVVGLGGAVVEGALEPTSELALHLGAYARPGTGAVVHTHAPMATALACVDGLDEVPCVHYEMLALGGAVRVAPYATFGTDALARGALAALEGRHAALLANHGAVTVGPDLDAAVRAAEVLEHACGVYWRAAQVGRPRTLGEEQLGDVAAQMERLGYGAPRRRA